MANAPKILYFKDEWKSKSNKFISCGVKNVKTRKENKNKVLKTERELHETKNASAKNGKINKSTSKKPRKNKTLLKSEIVLQYAYGQELQ